MSYNFNKEFINYLKPLLNSENIYMRGHGFLDDKLISFPGAPGLIEIMNSIHLFEGHHTLGIDLLEAVIFDQKNLVRAYFNTLSKSEDNFWSYKLLESYLTSNIDFNVFPEKEFLNPIAIAVLYRMGYHDHAKSCLEKYSRRYHYSEVSIDCAILWHFLFENTSKSKYLLSKKSILLNDEFDYLRYAKYWKLLFNNDSKSKSYIQKASHVFDSLILLNNITELIKALYNDDNEVLKLLYNAEKHASFSCDWGMCAEVWKSLFNNNTETEKCLFKSEQSADSCFDWIRCAEEWINLMNYRKAAFICMNKAEEKAENSGDWLLCADIWEKHFKHSSNISKCLLMAEQTAKLKSEIDEYLMILNSIQVDRNKWQLLLTEAESLAKSTEDWLKLSEVLLHIEKDEEKAKDFIIKAENAASSFLDWLNCAKAWKFDPFHVDDLIRCIEEALYISNNFEDSLLCAEYSMNLTSEYILTKNCLLKAEGLSSSSMEYHLCAANYEDLLGDKISAQKCRRVANQTQNF